MTSQTIQRSTILRANKAVCKSCIVEAVCLFLISLVDVLMLPFMIRGYETLT